MTSEFSHFSHTKNLRDRISGSDGKIWHFLVWFGTINGAWLHRIFFWDDKKTETGLLELADNEALNMKKIRARMVKLAKDRKYRLQYLQPLKFPIERYW